jgi:hypothetical protein
MAAKRTPKSTATATTVAPKGVTDRLAETAKDVVYIGVGAGVLAFQRAQVQRVELTKAIEERVAESRKQFADLTKAATTTAEGQLARIDERVTELEIRVEDALEGVQHRLPKPAADIFGQARTAARTTRGQVRGQVRELLNIS